MSVAIVVLCRERCAAFAKRNGLDASAPNTPAAIAAILARIAQATRDQPPNAHVRAVHTLLQPWTVEDGSMTPALKIKRHVIEELYQIEIEALYLQQALRRRSEV